jgi:hypothetical protein
MKRIKEMCRIEEKDEEVMCIEYSRNDRGNRMID